MRKSLWIVALVLNVVPGSEGENDYGPPPGPNTVLVKVGAVLFIAFTALAVVANVKYTQYVRSGKIHTAADPGTPGSDAAQKRHPSQAAVLAQTPWSLMYRVCPILMVQPAHDPQLVSRTACPQPPAFPPARE